jgi:transketolase
MGTMTGKAVEIADTLKCDNVSVQVWNISCPNDIDEDALKKAAQTSVIFTYEDHNVNTGLGNSIADKLMQMGLSCKFHKFGVEDYCFSGNSRDLFRMYKLDVKSVVDRIKKIIL